MVDRARPNRIESVLVIWAARWMIPLICLGLGQNSWLDPELGLVGLAGGKSNKLYCPSMNLLARTAHRERG